MKCKCYKVRNIRRGTLPSGVRVYFGEVSIRGQKITVASVDKSAGSWFSV